MISLLVNAQSGNVLSSINTITTAVPFLSITPDARAGGMGETGVATSPDANAIHWNPAKLTFADKKMSIGISYTPWLRALVPDINLVYLSLYSKLDSNTTIGSSIRYFSLGNITTISSTSGATTGQYRPNEFAIDVCYSRRFVKYWSVGIAGRFIQSNLGNSTFTTTSGHSVAADVSVYYYDNDRVKIFEKKCTMIMGLAITNVGAKMSYSNAVNKAFLPINLRLGQGFKIDLDHFNSISFQYEFNKLLVPSPPIYELDSNGMPIVNSSGSYVILEGKNPDVSVPRGMVQSFYDAPGGSREEMEEITTSVGMEYWYNKIFSIRAGYFYENKHKGDRQYFTLGAGLKYNIFGLDFAYLIPTNGQRSPLEHTLRFTLLFDFDKRKSS